MSDADQSREVTRRFVLACGVAALTAGRAAAARPPELVKAIETLGPYFTPQANFQDVSRGTPLPIRSRRRRGRRSA